MLFSTLPDAIMMDVGQGAVNLYNLIVEFLSLHLGRDRLSNLKAVAKHGHPSITDLINRSIFTGVGRGLYLLGPRLGLTVY